MNKKILFGVVSLILIAVAVFYANKWSKIRSENAANYTAAELWLDENMSFERMEANDEYPAGRFVKAKMHTLDFEIPIAYSPSTGVSKNPRSFSIRYYGLPVMSPKEASEIYGRKGATPLPGEKWPVYHTRMFIRLKSNKIDRYQSGLKEINRALNNPDKIYRESERYPELKEFIYVPSGKISRYVYEYKNRDDVLRTYTFSCPAGMGEVRTKIYICTGGLSMSEHVYVLWRFDKRVLENFPDFFHSSIAMLESFITSPNYQMDD